MVNLAALRGGGGGSRISSPVVDYDFSNLGYADGFYMGNTLIYDRMGSGSRVIASEYYHTNVSNGLGASSFYSGGFNFANNVYIADPYTLYIVADFGAPNPEYVMTYINNSWYGNNANTSYYIGGNTLAQYSPGFNLISVYCTAAGNTGYMRVNGVNRAPVPQANGTGGGPYGIGKSDNSNYVSTGGSRWGEIMICSGVDFSNEGRLMHKWGIAGY